MIGGIYTSEKCAICGSGMRDNGRSSVCCPKHPSQRAIGLFVRFGREVFKRFTSYEDASRFLNGVRYETDRGTYDVRDYKRENPLGFTNLADKWLELKQSQIKRKSWNNLRNYMRKAQDVWENRNIKEIGYAEIEDFLFQDLRDLSSKSRSNAASALHSFWDWLRKRRVLTSYQLPEIPSVTFELHYRKTIGKQTQERILDELRSISWDINPRIWIAVKWLSTYIAIRPGEMIQIKEGEIDREGFIIIPHPKEKKPKVVPMLEEDVELIQSLPQSFPQMPFLRHPSGEQFGPRYLYKWWKKACLNLGIDDVDLYAGTRHSTAIYLGKHFTPEQIKAATFHTTNKAFERYFRVQPDQLRDVYRVAKDRQTTERILHHPKKT